MSFPVVIFNDTRVDLHHGCTRVMTAIEYLVVKHGGHVQATIPAHTEWKDNDIILETLRTARLIVVNGEGTIHHDSAAGLRLLEVAEVARREGVPAVLLNCGWQDNSPAFRGMLNGFSLVSARDRLSVRQMQVAGCRVVPDLSLYLPGENIADPRNGIAFTDSVVRPTALELDRLRQVCGGSTSSIQHVGNGAAAIYRFFRSYVGAADLRDPAFLVAMVALRYRQYRAQTAEVSGYLRHLAGLELLVSGRFHACTLAMVEGTPFIAVESNSHKIRALVSDAGLADWRIATALTPMLIAEARATGWTPDERARLRDYLQHARSATDALFREIAGLA